MNDEEMNKFKSNYDVKDMDRLDYLMKDKNKLLNFMNLVVSQDYDCQKCPFCDEDGFLMGCNAGHANNDCENDYELDCQLNYEDVYDFLHEKMPTKKQMNKWKKEINREVQYEIKEKD